ncbi:hypothetical protein D3C79_521890 [compost metagenome]
MVARRPGEALRIVAAQGIHHGLIQLQQLVDPDPAAIAGEVAALAAAPLVVGMLTRRLAGEHAEPGGLALVRGLLLDAVLAYPPHQALGHHGPQGAGHQIAGGAHVDQAQGAGHRIVGVQRGQHQVAGDGAAQAYLHRLVVPHLPHQQDVRILAQGGAQHLGEGEADLGIDLHLVDPRQPVLHRIFHRDDLVAGLVELGEGAVERRGLAATGRSGHQDHAVGAFELAAKTRQDRRRHAGLGQRQDAGGLIQQSHHHGFPVLHRHGGHTHIHVPAAHLHGEAAILGQPLLGDVEPGHQLEAQHQRLGDAHLAEDVLVQHAVDALADAQHLLVRLDVDIRGPHLHRVLEQGAQQLGHRRLPLVGPGIEVAAAELEPGLLMLLVQLHGEVLDLAGAAIEPVEILQQLAFPCHRQHQLARAEQGGDGIQGAQVGGIRHGHRHLVVAEVDRQRTIATGLHLRQQRHGRGVYGEVVEIEEGHVQLTGEELQQLHLADEAEIDQGGPQLAAGLTLLLQGELQLIIGDDLLLHQQIAEPHFQSGLCHCYSKFLILITPITVMTPRPIRRP